MLDGACGVMIKTRSARIVAISMSFKYRCTLHFIHTTTVQRLVLKCPRALHVSISQQFTHLRQTLLTVPSTVIVD